MLVFELFNNLMFKMFQGSHRCLSWWLITNGWEYGIWRHFQQYFSYIVTVSFIGGGNWSTRRKPLTCRKSLASFIV
jgi:hypothetical protein